MRRSWSHAAGGLLLLVAATSAVAHCAGAEGVQVTLYGEALCPYCARFTREVVAPLLQEDAGLSGIFNFSYVAWGNAVRTEDGVVCQHGDLECKLNRQPALIPRLPTLAVETELPPNVIQGGWRRRVISCAQDLYPEQGRWFPFVSCIEKHPGAGPRRGRKCARGAHLNTTAIAECAAGKHGEELDMKAEAATSALKPPHTYVPWVVVDGVPLGVDYTALRSVICVAYKGNRPDGCKQVPSARTRGGPAAVFQSPANGYRQRQVTSRA